MSNRNLSDRGRFDAKWTPEPNTGCWLWLASLNHAGYGQNCLRGVKTRMAHRHAWMLYRGPIPSGMVLDHICRVRSCVNPDHLRVVTHAQNNIENSLSGGALNKQKTHCLHGHLYDEANTLYYRYNGGTQRHCRACDRIQHKRRYVPRSIRAAVLHPQGETE